VAERIGVLGGTFDPIHNGHLALAQAAREQLDLDRLIFVPAGVPWRKAGRKITPGSQRLEMVRLAVKSDAAAEISTLEIEEEGPSYTAETLAALAEQYPGAELYFILGEDALADLPNWRQPDRILALARLAVARRDSSTRGPEIESAPGGDKRIVWLDLEPVKISASDIRKRIRSGKHVKGMLPPPVEDYIRRCNLYRTSGG
jgi:nicotinate-nucleotide adenylyltransferase